MVARAQGRDLLSISAITVMRVVVHRALRALACAEKNQFFYNLNVQGNRRAAQTLANDEPYTGPSG